MLANKMFKKAARIFGFEPKSPFNKGELNSQMAKRLLAACRDRDSSRLVLLMDEQDRIILRAIAQAGDVEKAKYALDRRFAVLESEQYPIREAALRRNCAVFRYVLERNPALITNKFTGLETLAGSVEIWRTTLELNHDSVDWDFGHSGSQGGF
ncbi:MAG: hypothetical protein M1820_009686 [Bogoriella megaspora]|nr:MAG: hypothetical protein M1820_009686 [Bogoriella megaspora]